MPIRFPIINSSKATSGVAPTFPFEIGEVLNGGFVDYNDAATQTTPISVIGGAAPVTLTNDSLGTFTNKNFLPTGITDIFNSTTNQFDWTQLNNGDMVDIRLDLLVTTTSPNQSVDVSLVMAAGEAGEYPILFSTSSYKTVREHPVNRFNGVYMGDDFTRLNAAEFRISSDSNCTVKVNGWYCKIIRRG